MSAQARSRSEEEVEEVVDDFGRVGPNACILPGWTVGAVALVGANYLLVRFVFKHRRLDQLLEGRPTTLIEGGRIRRDGLAKELLTESELLMVEPGWPRGVSTMYRAAAPR